MEDRRETLLQDAGAPTRRLTLPLLVLVGLTLVSQLVSLAYTSDQSTSDILLPSVIALLIVTTPLAAAGLWLGTGIGLGAPLLSALLFRHPGSARQLVRDVAVAAVLGLLAGAFLLALRFAIAAYLPPDLPEFGHRGVVGGLLVSVSAAIGEEVWLRLGVMTIIAWLLARLAGHAELTPRLAWPSIVVAALAFGLIHLPQLAANEAATLVGIAGTMFGNTLVGTACGWLYWKRSLLAAIFAHFFVDLVLHVLPAFAQ